MAVLQATNLFEAQHGLENLALQKSLVSTIPSPVPTYELFGQGISQLHDVFDHHIGHFPKTLP